MHPKYDPRVLEPTVKAVVAAFIHLFYYELVFPIKVFCQTSLNSKYHSYIHPLLGIHAKVIKATSI